MASMDPICIDLSHHNATPDWHALAAVGIRGVIHKATEGCEFVDDTYAERRSAAISAGLGWSSYHFLRRGDISGQMEHFLDVVDPADGERLVLDYEDPELTIDDLRAAITTLRKQCEAEITVYGASGFLGAQLDGAYDDVLASCSLWVASYTSASSPTMTGLTGTWPSWSLWQHSDCGFFADMGPYDSNRWNGSAKAFDLWIEPIDGLPILPAAELPVITITVTSEQPIALRVIVDSTITIIE